MTPFVRRIAVLKYVLDGRCMRSAVDGYCIWNAVLFYYYCVWSHFQGAATSVCSLLKFAVRAICQGVCGVLRSFCYGRFLNKDIDTHIERRGFANVAVEFDLVPCLAFLREGIDSASERCKTGYDLKADLLRCRCFSVIYRW